MCRSEGHVFDGAADQRPCQAPRGLQAHHAHLSGRCRECQSLQAQIPWSDEQQPAWVKICEGPRSRWCNVHVIRLVSYGTVWFSFTVIFSYLIFFPNQAPIWTFTFMFLLQPAYPCTVSLWRTIHWSWAVRSCPRKCLTTEMLERWTFMWRASGFLTKTSMGSSASTSVCWSPSLQ